VARLLVIGTVPVALAEALAALELDATLARDLPEAGRPTEVSDGLLATVLVDPTDDHAELGAAPWPRPLLLLSTEAACSRLVPMLRHGDDFALVGGSAIELAERLRRILAASGAAGRPRASRAARQPDADGEEADEVIVCGPLRCNLTTYQAEVAGRPLDLTFMEYELLRFLAARPGRVFTREVLLREVWGYEYLGGSRTVDVHIRRLRAKLGESQAHLIETVRSVGYRFGRLHR
jgi:DNA-binding response OmpR family regulator